MINLHLFLDRHGIWLDGFFHFDFVNVVDNNGDDRDAISDYKQEAIEVEKSRAVERGKKCV